MGFEPSARAARLLTQLRAFMDEVVYPNETVFADQVQASTNRWESPAVMETIKSQARAAGLWNLFLLGSEHGAGLTNVEYAPLCEEMGRSPIAPEAFNCAAPDTGNMEVLARYGTSDQQAEWLAPLLAGRIRSAYAMTEPQVASSDATNISASIEANRNDYVINGHKWWITGAGHANCQVFIFMGKTDPSADRCRLPCHGTPSRSRDSLEVAPTPPGQSLHGSPSKRDDRRHACRSACD